MPTGELPAVPEPLPVFDTVKVRLEVVAVVGVPQASPEGTEDPAVLKAEVR
jgi:hypothetical protein